MELHLTRKVLPCAALILLSATVAAASQITPTGIAVWPNQRSSGNLPAEAIDGNTSTYTWATESFTTGVNYIALDFGGSVALNRIRLFVDPDYGPHDWVIGYTTGGGTLSGRSFADVSGMVNGYLGSELLVASAVNSDGSVTGETHTSSGLDGWASLTFNSVNATGVRIQFTSPGFNHLKLYEFEAYDSPVPSSGAPEPGSIALALGGASMIILVRRFKAN